MEDIYQDFKIVIFNCKLSLIIKKLLGNYKESFCLKEDF